MTITIKINDAPSLRVDKDGVIRVGKTRVILDLVVNAYHRGQTPEEIVKAYTALNLADVYGAIGYYLHHKEELDKYLQQRKEVAEAFRAEQMKQQEGLKAKLEARKKEQSQQVC